MHKNKHSKYLKIAVYCIVAVLALSNIHIFKASAAENYFTAEGGTLEFDEVEPDQRTIWVKLKRHVR